MANKGSDKISLHSKLRRKMRKYNIDSSIIRKKQLLEANAEEDKSIHRLEKLLKFKKKKNIPSAFSNDGLDYILDVINNKEAAFSDFSDNEEEIKNEKSFHLSVKNKKSYPSKSLPKKQRTLTELLKEQSGEISSANNSDASDDMIKDSDNENNSISEEDNSNNELENEETCDSHDELPPETKQKPKIWEDIYGRLRDESGNFIKNQDTKDLYIPPVYRKRIENSENNEYSEKVLKIKQKLKGLLNRLSESNIQPISTQIEDMYMKNSRNDMNETLFSLISSLVLSNVLTPFRLILEQAMLIALLHANIGPEIGAYFLQHLIIKLDQLFKLGESYGEGKQINNVIIFISHLYNFKVTHSILIFDIFHHLIHMFQDKDIELIQLLLKDVGFNLRKDNPLKLKEIILSIQAKASSYQSKENSFRINFMIETLTAIRNNNIYKIPDYDPSFVEHAKKTLKGYIRKGSYIQELSISYEDLLKSEERGRWWIVGSAWNKRDTSSLKSTNESNQINLPLKTNFSEKILKLAQKHHMNTDVRKSVFCIIMTAEDYMDAFEKLLHLNLKNQQFQEIINVLLHCTLHEKKFNPYYAYLAQKFVTFSRKYYISLQFSLWDKFKEFSNFKEHELNNLSSFLTQLFISGALPLSVLKVIHFSEMNKTMVKFFKKMLTSILLDESEEKCCEAFKRIATAKNLNLLRESLRLFMHHFILKNTSKVAPDIARKLNERVKLAENALNSAKHAFKL